MEYGDAALSTRRDALAALLRLLGRAEAGRLGQTVDLDASPPEVATAVRRLVVHLDDFGDFVRRAAGGRDPALVVRYLDDLVQIAAGVRAAPLPPSLWHAVAIVVRNGLALLAIDLPPSLRFLPPAYVSRNGLPQVAPPGAAPA